MVVPFKVVQKVFTVHTIFIFESAQMDKRTVKKIYKPHFHFQKVSRWTPDIIVLY